MKMNRWRFMKVMNEGKKNYGNRIYEIFINKAADKI